MGGKSSAETASAIEGEYIAMTWFFWILTLACAMACAWFNTHELGSVAGMAATWGMVTTAALVVKKGY